MSDSRGFSRKSIICAIQAVMFLGSANIASLAIADTAVQAESAAIHINVKPSSLSQALNELSSQAGIYISGQGELTQGIKFSGMKGSYDIDSALDKMLEGTGLTVKKTGAKRYSLQKKAEINRHDLQAIEVIGVSDNKPYSETSFATTKTETHILDTPQSITSVNSKVIQEHNLMRLNDIAPFVAGVNEASVYNDLTIRGFRSSDDRRINGMRTFNNFWTQASIPHLERVEVVKGATAATFGDSSPGGVINMVTKKPLAESRQELHAVIGSYDQKYIAADLTGAINADESLLYRLNIAGEDSDSFREQIDSEVKTIAPSFSYLPSDRTRLNLDIVYSDQKTVADRGQPNIEDATTLGLIPIEVSVSQPGDLLDFDEFSATFSLEHELNDDWTVVFSHMHFSLDEKLIEHRIRGAYASPSVANLAYNNRDRDAELDTTSLYLTGNFMWGDFEHKLLVGVDKVERSYDTVNRSERNVATFDLLNPVYQTRDTDSYTLSTATWGGTSESLAFYLQDQIIYGDWELLLGGRYDDFSQKSYDGGLTLEKQSDGQFSPRAGLVYKLTDYQSIYGAWVTGFEPQDPEINFARFGGPFEPSESELLEVGYKHIFVEEELFFTASLYELTQSNVVVSANDPLDDDLRVQRGEERSRGLELELNGHLTPNLSVIANYAWNDAEISKDTDPQNVGARKENAPEHTATLWGKYRLNANWSVGGGASYVSERDTYQEGLKLPAYTVYNAGVYYTHKDFEASLLGNNLTDKTHWTGGYGASRLFPGDPRSFSLNMKYRF